MSHAYTSARFARLAPCLAAVALAACGSSATADPGWGPGDASSVDLSAFGTGDGVADAQVADAQVADAQGADAVSDTAGPVDGAAAEVAPKDSGAADVTKSDLGAADTAQPNDVQDDVEDVAGPVAQCGDSICAASETWATCSLDCAPPASVCGDGMCTPGENAIACQVDCDPETVGVLTCLKKSCASAVTSCLGAPDCTSVLANAAQCLANCIDSDCVTFCKNMANQNASAGAVATCGFAGCVNATAGTICGDGTCNLGETTGNCPADCPPVAPSGGCGNGTCDGGETAATCPIDCDADFAKAWACGAAKCPAEAAACKADPTCLDALTKVTNCIKQCGTGSGCVGQCRGPVLSNSKALSFAMCGLQNCQ